MHDKLLKTHPDELVPPSPADAPVPAPRIPSENEIDLVLRLWAGELQRPKKRGRPTLYTKAQALVEDPLVLAVCRAVCLHLALVPVIGRSDPNGSKK